MLHACCLDKIQTFEGRYMSLEKVLLHCLKGFNENTCIPNCYPSLKEHSAVKNTGKEI